MEKRSLSEDMSGAWNLMKLRAKVLFVAQGVLSVALLLTLLYDFMKEADRLLLNQIELSLVIALLIVSALRSYPERKKSILLYMVCVVVAVVCLVINCFL